MANRISWTLIGIFASLLCGCGNGSGSPDAQPYAGTYAYGQNGFGTQCNPQVVQDWLTLVVPACSQASGPGNNFCSQGVQQMIFRDGGSLQGPGCSIPMATAQWCPNGNNQQYVQVNTAILQSLLTQFGGPASIPASGGFSGNGGFPR